MALSSSPLGPEPNTDEADSSGTRPATEGHSDGIGPREKRPDARLVTAPMAESFRWDRATPAERQAYSARRARQDRIAKGLPAVVRDERIYDKLVELFR